MISVINQTRIDSYFTSFEPSTLCCCCFKKLLNGSRGASGADPSPGAQPNPARLGVAGAYPAPPGGSQESTQPNREVRGDAGSFLPGSYVLPASASFALVVVDGFPKEIELELGRAEHINSPSQSCHPEVQGPEHGQHVACR